MSSVNSEDHRSNTMKCVCSIKSTSEPGRDSTWKNSPGFMVNLSDLDPFTAARRKDLMAHSSDEYGGSINQDDSDEVVLCRAYHSSRWSRGGAKLWTGCQLMTGLTFREEPSRSNI